MEKLIKDPNLKSIDWQQYLYTIIIISFIVYSYGSGFLIGIKVIEFLIGFTTALALVSVIAKLTGYYENVNVTTRCENSTHITTGFATLLTLLICGTGYLLPSFYLFSKVVISLNYNLAVKAKDAKYTRKKKIEKEVLKKINKESQKYLNKKY